jgi:hypothetical protein
MAEIKPDKYKFVKGEIFEIVEGVEKKVADGIQITPIAASETFKAGVSGGKRRRGGSTIKTTLGGKRRRRSSRRRRH